MAHIQTRDEADRHAARNAGFVNSVRSFANRAATWPGMPVLPLASIAAAAIMIVVGGFGTGAMPVATRAGFWTVLMAMAFVKWQSWFIVTVHRPGDWWRSVMLATVILNLSLPFEIRAASWLLGIPAHVDSADTWARALAISGVVAALIVILRQYNQPEAAPAVVAKPSLPPLLAKAGIPAPDSLAAIVAEDHYCRLHRADGHDALIHHRFGDALTAVAAFDGAQVHRGAWVASGAVIGAVRDGRRWRLVLANNVSVPVSARFVATARARGWLRPVRMHPGS